MQLQGFAASSLVRKSSTGQSPGTLRTLYFSPHPSQTSHRKPLLALKPSAQPRALLALPKVERPVRTDVEILARALVNLCEVSVIVAHLLNPPRLRSWGLGFSQSPNPLEPMLCAVSLQAAEAFEPRRAKAGVIPEGMQGAAQAGAFPCKAKLILPRPAVPLSVRLECFSLFGI